jgi:hypothetical protein
VGGELIAYGCDCCGRVQNFGSEIIFQVRSYPEFDYILKSFRFLIFLKEKLAKYHYFYILNLIWPTPKSEVL